MTENTKINLPICIWKEVLDFLDNDRYVPMLESRIERQKSTITRVREVYDNFLDDNRTLQEEVTRLENIIMERNNYIAELEQKQEEDHWKILHLEQSLYEIRNHLAFMSRRPVRRRLTYEENTV
jgi:predicted RNase H-like nuclease (RuvC/YqgF family)